MSGKYLSDEFISGLTKVYGITGRCLAANIADNANGTAAEFGLATPGYSGNVGESSTYKTWEEMQETIKNGAKGN